jgi:hypothetical protein
MNVTFGKKLLPLPALPPRDRLNPARLRNFSRSLPLTYRCEENLLDLEIRLYLTPNRTLAIRGTSHGNHEGIRHEPF